MRLKTIITLFLLSMAIYAQKAPKGKLLSYSHTISNPEIPIDYEFFLNSADGKGTFQESNKEYDYKKQYTYTVEVGEEVLQQVADIFKEKKLYKFKKEEPDPHTMPYAYPGREYISIQFEDKSFNFNIIEMSSDQLQTYKDLESFIRERSRASLSAETLSGFTHSMEMIYLPPEIPDIYLYQLAFEDGKATLKVNHQGEKSPVVNVPSNVSEKVFKYFTDGHLYKPDNIFLAQPLKPASRIKESIEKVTFQFKNGIITISDRMLEKHCETLDSLDLYLNSVYDAAPVAYPKGKMIYCSCAYTNYGLPAGEIQHSYYELVADEGTTPKVIYCENRGEPKKTEYRATEKDVTELSNILRDMNIFKIDGYSVSEEMTGGTSYRVHMEFSSGEKLTASWFTHKPNALASGAYSTILRYLTNITKR